MEHLYLYFVRKHYQLTVALYLLVTTLSDNRSPSFH